MRKRAVEKHFLLRNVISSSINKGRWNGNFFIFLGFAYDLYHICIVLELIAFPFFPLYFQLSKTMTDFPRRLLDVALDEI